MKSMQTDPMPTSIIEAKTDRNLALELVQRHGGQALIAEFLRGHAAAMHGMPKRKARVGRA
jgi:hypothetical protein